MIVHLPLSAEGRWDCAWQCFLRLGCSVEEFLCIVQGLQDSWEHHLPHLRSCTDIQSPYVLQYARATALSLLPERQCFHNNDD